MVMQRSPPLFTLRPRSRVEPGMLVGGSTRQQIRDTNGTGGTVRDAFHEELAAITDSLVEMPNLVASAMARATTALLDADLQLAERVITADETVDLLYHE